MSGTRHFLPHMCHVVALLFCRDGCRPFTDGRDDFCNLGVLDHGSEEVTDMPATIPSIFSSF